MPMTAHDMIARTFSATREAFTLPAVLSALRPAHADTTFLAYPS